LRSGDPNASSSRRFSTAEWLVTSGSSAEGFAVVLMFRSLPRAARPEAGRIPSGRRGGYTAPMNRRPVSASVLLALALSLSGCGNKGPLVLPDAPAQETATPPAPAVEPAPADAAPADAAPATPAATDGDAKPPRR
jgi:predicted small lipoprotein YifL